jgi:hypothetical protein
MRKHSIVCRCSSREEFACRFASPRGTVGHGGVTGVCTTQCVSDDCTPRKDARPWFDSPVVLYTHRIQRLYSQAFGDGFGAAQFTTLTLTRESNP